MSKPKLTQSHVPIERQYEEKQQPRANVNTECGGRSSRISLALVAPVASVNGPEHRAGTRQALPGLTLPRVRCDFTTLAEQSNPTSRHPPRKTLVLQIYLTNPRPSLNLPYIPHRPSNSFKPLSQSPLVTVQALF